MKFLTQRWIEFFRLLQQNRQAYLWLNIAYYGLVLGGMILVANNPTFEQTLRTSIKANFNQQLLSAYTQGLALPAIVLTFWNNFVLASLMALTLPSLLIPFWGVIIGAGRAFLWGLALSPADPGFGSKIILHLPTLLLEGQGYILTM
ncbi:MAG TPA: hypothetical protein VMP08_13070, partial [Anaerolineae bacterium]|nr:hypothetical protein [Anaerolineae bacterium]